MGLGSCLLLRHCITQQWCWGANSQCFYWQGFLFSRSPFLVYVATTFNQYWCLATSLPLLHLGLEKKMFFAACYCFHLCDLNPSTESLIYCDYYTTLLQEVVLCYPEFFTKSIRLMQVGKSCNSCPASKSHGHCRKVTLATLAPQDGITIFFSLLLLWDLTRIRTTTTSKQHLELYNWEQQAFFCFSCPD